MVQRATANGAGAASNGNAIPAEEFSRLLPEITALTERLRFNVVCHGPQKFAWTEIPLGEVKTIKGKFGTSVNDVVLTLVTAAFRRYLEAHGDPVEGRLLRMMVPVNSRGNFTAAELGNNISLIPVTVPLDIRDPRELLEGVHRRSEFLKRAHAAEIVGLTGGLVGFFPNGLQALAGPILSQLPITPFNLVCTNVPGPQFPLYLLGHKMLRWYPYVPIGGEMAVNCAILSYDGMMYFGFSGNVHAAPDLRRLEDFVKESFAELREAAGIRTPRKQTARRKQTSSKKRTKAKAKVARPVNGSASKSVNIAVPPSSEAMPRPSVKEKAVAPQLITQ
jgi:diacylglycerol O-acyltransferase